MSSNVTDYVLQNNQQTSSWSITLMVIEQSARKSFSRYSK